jgi:hypothetical protein
MSVMPGDAPRPSSGVKLARPCGRDRTIKVYRLIEGRYARVHELTLEGDDILTTPLLPGLELRLQAILHEPA